MDTENVAEVSAKGGLAEWKAHWKVVLAAACGMTFATMPSYTMGVFIGPLEQEFGWSRTAATSVLIGWSLTAICIGPLMGYAVDRLGPRRIGVLGVLLVPAMLASLSFATPSLALWWALWMGISVAGLFAKSTIWVSGVSSFFAQGRGVAFAVTLCGASVGSSLVPVISNYFIEHYGWRMGYVGVAASFAILFAPPVLLFFSSAPDRQRTQPRRDARQPVAVLAGVSARAAFTSFRFYRLALAGFAMTLCATSLIVNLVPILISKGQAAAAAASFAGLLGIGAIVGRLVTGFLLDRFNGNVVAALSVGAPALSCILLLAAPHSLVALGAVVLILGLAAGAEFDILAYLASRHFGLRNFGVIFATIGGVAAVASGLGPVLANFSYDATQSYQMTVIAAIPLSVIASLLFFSLGAYPTFADDARSGKAAPAEGRA